MAFQHGVSDPVVVGMAAHDLVVAAKTAIQGVDVAADRSDVIALERAGHPIVDPVGGWRGGGRCRMVHPSN
jgi:hypothetical protein